MRPGVNTLSRDSGGSATRPISTGVAAAGYIGSRGRTDQAFLVRSQAAALKAIGPRTNWNATSWDAIESYYLFGGRDLWLSRAVGPDAVKASANINGPGVGAPYSLTAEAVGEGDWYNGINLTFEAVGATRRVVITHDDDDTISEISPYYATQAELAAWSLNSEFVRFTVGGEAAMPVAAAIPLAGGDDDHAAITTDEKADALARFVKSIGKGIQVCFPGAWVEGDWDAVLEHAELFDRNAILAYPDTGVEATLITLADTARARGRAGAGFNGFARLPLSGGGYKWVSPELIVCAKIAAWDSASAGLGQNRPVAGPKRGRLERVQDLSQTWEDDDEITRLNEAGVNLIRYVDNVPMIYGWRSLVDSEADGGWANFGHRRLDTALKAKGERVLGEFAFEELSWDVLKQAQAAITSRVVDPYFRFGSLYSENGIASEAYRVDVDSVNDAETIQDRQLNVDVSLVEAEFAEELNLTLTKKLITEGVA